MIQTFHACKQEEGKPVGPYILKMNGYMEQLERLGYVLPQDISVGLILNGLTSDFAKFVRNYNMHNMGKTIDELHALLIEYEKCLSKKAATLQLIMKKKQVGTVSSSGLRGSRKLKQGALYLYVGNGVRAQVEVIGSYDLVLPNGLVICLNNCHYTPTITRGVVSVSCLVDNGFTQCFTDYGISVSKNDVLYFNVISSNGIYEIDIINRVPNVNSIYIVSNKRSKHNLDSIYLWHCHLAHISKKHIEKLQHDGLLKSIDEESFNSIYIVSNKRSKHNLDSIYLWHCHLTHISKKRIEKLQHDRFLKSIDEESFDKCVSCLSGKMTRKPFPHRTERVTDLLGIICTDVCGPLRHVSRQAAYSSIYTTTQWDDYALETAVRILNMVPTKKVDKTPNKLCGRAEELKEIQDEDTSPSENTSNIHMEVEEVEKHSLGDLSEPTNYKAEILDSESDKWVDVMNAKMQSMKDNQVWRLSDLPPNTFSPIADIRAIRILIAIATFYDYEIWQMDVKTAFLNGYLDEDIYMVQPEGFVDPNHPRKASRSNVTFLILYVDDIIIMGNHIPSLQSVKTHLGKCFAIKDLGEATFILEIKIYRDRSKRLIRLSQSAYMDKILKRYRMDNSKRGYIPMQEKLDLNKTQDASTPEEVKRMQNVPYASAVGSIMYAVRCTRPDVAFAQNITSLDCYCDAGFETDRDDTKSQTGYVFILNGGALDWKSSKQSTTAMSATKAEYIAASEAGMEVVWIRKLILGLGIVLTINKLIKIFCDDSVALHFANEPGVQNGARHYHRRYHYVRECIKLGKIKLLKVHTDDNLANPFTKALSKEILLNMLGA
ncbi:retrotransposon protein, putative, ty1-copia subclass [Tanacetum coccineum]